MKIRKGFVTNSSSYSSAAISIQSGKLVSLLKQYEDLIGPNGMFDAIIKEKTFDTFWDEYTEAWCEEVPKTLDEVLDNLIDGLNDFQSGFPEAEERFHALIQEIKDQKQELTDSLEKVNWWFENNSYDEFEPDDVRKKSFTYNRRSKKTGGAGVYSEE